MKDEYSFELLKNEKFKEGIKKGKEEGKKERDIEIAKASLKQGIDINTISIITGLAIQEIEKLKKE